MRDEQNASSISQSAAADLGPDEAHATRTPCAGGLPCEISQADTEREMDDLSMCCSPAVRTDLDSRSQRIHGAMP